MVDQYTRICDGCGSCYNGEKPIPMGKNGYLYCSKCFEARGIALFNARYKELNNYQQKAVNYNRNVVKQYEKLNPPKEFKLIKNSYRSLIINIIYFAVIGVITVIACMVWNLLHCSN